MSKVLERMIKFADKIKEVLDYVEANPNSSYLASQNESFDDIKVKYKACNNKKAISINDEDSIVLVNNDFRCISTANIETNGYNFIGNKCFVTLELENNALLGVFYNHPQAIVFLSNNDNDIDIINIFNVRRKMWRKGVRASNEHEISDENRKRIEEYSKNVFNKLNKRLEKSKRINDEEEEYFKGFDNEYEEYIAN